MDNIEMQIQAHVNAFIDKAAQETDDLILGTMEDYLTEEGYHKKIEINGANLKAIVEKQIAKKLISIRKIKRFDGYDMGNCPVCGEALDNSFYENLNYCFVCGQKIDWSDEDEM